MGRRRENCTVKLLSRTVILLAPPLTNFNEPPTSAPLVGGEPRWSGTRRRSADGAFFFSPRRTTVSLRWRWTLFFLSRVEWPDWTRMQWPLTVGKVIFISTSRGTGTPYEHVLSCILYCTMQIQGYALPSRSR